MQFKEWKIELIKILINYQKLLIQMSMRQVV